MFACVLYSDKCHVARRQAELRSSHRARWPCWKVLPYSTHSCSASLGRLVTYCFVLVYCRMGLAISLVSTVKEKVGFMVVATQLLRQLCDDSYCLYGGYVHVFVRVVAFRSGTTQTVRTRARVATTRSLSSMVAVVSGTMNLRYVLLFSYCIHLYT